MAFLFLAVLVGSSAVSSWLVQADSALTCLHDQTSFIQHVFQLHSAAPAPAPRPRSNAIDFNGFIPQNVHEGQDDIENEVVDDNGNQNEADVDNGGEDVNRAFHIYMPSSLCNYQGSKVALAGINVHEENGNLNMQQPGAGESVQRCANAVLGNERCGERFYFKLGTCRCMQPLQDCKPQKNNEYSIYDLGPGTFHIYMPSSLCNYQGNRVALAGNKVNEGSGDLNMQQLGAGESVPRCASAVLGNEKCSDRFYFKLGTCRCMQRGQHCVPQNSNEYSIYDLGPGEDALQGVHNGDHDID